MDVKYGFGRQLTQLLCVLVVWSASVCAAQAQLYSTKAAQALLMDADTGTILFSKEPDAQIPPASLAKLMTMEVVFSSLKNGSASLTDTFFVSEMPGAKVAPILVGPPCLRNSIRKLRWKI